MIPVQGITSLYHRILTFNEGGNIVGTGENAGNQHFLLSPNCFQPFPNDFFKVTLILSPANAINLKVLSFGKGLTLTFILVCK